MPESPNLSDEKLRKQLSSVIKFLYWMIIIGGTFLFMKYLLPALMPFILAYFIAWLLNRPITYVHEKIHIPRGVVSAVFVILFAFFGGGIITLLGISLGNNIRSIASAIPDIVQNGVLPFLHEFLAEIENFVSIFDPEGGEVLENIMTAVLSTINEGTVYIGSVIVGFLGGMLAKVPSVLFKTIITIIASIFMATDFEIVKNSIIRLIPESGKAILNEGTQFFGKTVVRCGFSYILILSVTFAELWAGFSLLGMQNSAIIAFIIAVLDILPVLGTGTILIPWSVILLLTGKFSMGAYIFGLYIVITAVRNMIEPKLVGRQIKLHPVLTLAGMLVGGRFFGLLGMLGLPLGMAFIRRLNDQGIIHLWFLKDTEEDSSKDS